MTDEEVLDLLCKVRFDSPDRHEMEPFLMDYWTAQANEKYDKQQFDENH